MSTDKMTEPFPSTTGLETKLAETTLTPPPANDEEKPKSILDELRQIPAGPRKVPIIDPHESSKIPEHPALTAEQETKYNTLLEEVKTWKEIPSMKGKEGPITDREIMWLTRECLLRYLRATKWSIPEASKRLLGTLTWRREYGTEELTADHISPENETGKQFTMGYDIDGRPCHYLNPGRQNTEPSPRQTQHLVYMVERVIEIGLPGQETLSLLINFQASKTRSNTAPGIGQAREVLNILQTHYPERLGKALIINVPWLVKGFFKLITPFIDPMTINKLKFNDDMRQFVPSEQLWTEWNGDLDFDYEHETYWPALVKLCEEKRLAMTERWVKGGKLFGESEFYLKGGNAPSVGQTQLPVQTPAVDEISEKVTGSVQEPLKKETAA